MSRFRRLARDYERLPETQAGLHYVAFVILMLKNVVEILTYKLITGSRRKLFSTKQIRPVLHSTRLCYTDLNLSEELRTR